MNMPKHMARKATRRRNGIGALTFAAAAGGAGTRPAGIAAAAVAAMMLSPA